MKILASIIITITKALALQQIAYGIWYNEWIDFSTWSATTLGFEALFILSIVFSSIVAATRVAVRPMKSSRTMASEDIGENIYFPKEQ
jgi:hypothetical protein